MWDSRELYLYMNIEFKIFCVNTDRYVYTLRIFNSQQKNNEYFVECDFVEFGFFVKIRGRGLGEQPRYPDTRTTWWDQHFSVRPSRL